MSEICYDSALKCKGLTRKFKCKGKVIQGENVCVSHMQQRIRMGYTSYHYTPDENRERYNYAWASFKIDHECKQKGLFTKYKAGQMVYHKDDLTERLVVSATRDWSREPGWYRLESRVTGHIIFAQDKDLVLA